MAFRTQLSLSSIVRSRQLKVTSLIGLIMTCVALIVLAQNYYKYSGVEDYSVRLSLYYNLIVYGSYALLTPLMLKLADTVADMQRSWFAKFMLHLGIGIGLVLVHMLFANLVLYSIGLSTSPIFPRFLAKYLTNVIHIHLMVYWALALFITFYRNLYEQKDEVVLVKNEQLERFLIKENGRSFQLDFDKVLWIEAHDHYQKLHTTKGSHLIKDSMKSLEEKLPDEIFKRAHRSYFVNLRHLVAVSRQGDQNGYHLELDNGTQLKLSKAYLQHFPR